MFGNGGRQKLFRSSSSSSSSLSFCSHVVAMAIAREPTRHSRECPKPDLHKCENKCGHAHHRRS